MPPEVHCRLSPSASSRFLRCPKSVAMIESFEAVHGSGDSKPARQGSMSHRLAEISLGVLRHSITEKDAEAEREEIRNNPEFEKDLEWMANSYVKKIWQSYKTAGEDAVLLIEQKVSIPVELENGEIFDIFGTADAVVVSDELLSVFDYKSGYGKVNAADLDFIANPQITIYGLGCYLRLKNLYPDIKTIELNIIQPRQTDSSVRLSIKDLNAFRTGILEPGVRNCLSDRAVAIPGEIQCKYCPLATNMSCPALVRDIMDKVSDEELEELYTPQDIPDWRLEKVLKRLEAYSDMAKNAKSEMAVRIQAGAEFKDYEEKVNYSRYKWIDEDAARTALEAAGIGQDVYMVMCEPAALSSRLRKLGLKDGISIVKKNQSRTVSSIGVQPTTDYKKRKKEEAAQIEKMAKRQPPRKAPTRIQ